MQGGGRMDAVAAGCAQIGPPQTRAAGLGGAGNVDIAIADAVISANRGVIVRPVGTENGRAVDGVFCGVRGICPRRAGNGDESNAERIELALQRGKIAENSRIRLAVGEIVRAQAAKYVCHGTVRTGEQPAGDLAGRCAKAADLDGQGVTRRAVIRERDAGRYDSSLHIAGIMNESVVRAIGRYAVPHDFDRVSVGRVSQDMEGRQHEIIGLAHEQRRRRVDVVRDAGAEDVPFIVVVLRAERPVRGRRGI